MSPCTALDGVPSRVAFERLARLNRAGPFHVELGRNYRLEEAAQAHGEIEQHHRGWDEPSRAGCGSVDMAGHAAP